VSLWQDYEKEIAGNHGFFRISFLYIDLEHYYRLLFTLMKDHNFSLTEMEEMVPWEREIYVILLKEWIKEEKERQKRQNDSMPKMPSMPRVPRR